MSKNIVVIGATSDIAEAVEKIWAEQNTRLFLVARNEERLNTLSSDLQIRGAESVETAVLDVRNTDNFDSIIKQVKQFFNSIDIVLIAHGSLSDRDECETNMQKAVEEFTINATSVISLSLGFAELMKKQNGGTIAVISSVAGDRGRQSNYIYGSAKGALNTFLQGLRNRMYSFGVHVLTIKPGPVDTKMTDGKDKNLLWTESSTVARKIVSAIEKKINVVYIPGYWRIVMSIIKSIPEEVFKRLNL